MGVRKLTQKFKHKWNLMHTAISILNSIHDAASSFVEFTFEFAFALVRVRFRSCPVYPLAQLSPVLKLHNNARNAIRSHETTYLSYKSLTKENKWCCIRKFGSKFTTWANAAVNYSASFMNTHCTENRIRSWQTPCRYCYYWHWALLWNNSGLVTEF